MTTFRACEEPHQSGTEAGFKKTTPVLFPIPVLPRSTKRREGNVAMLQVERSARVLDRWQKTQAAKANTAFPDPLLPEARTSCFGGLATSTGRASCHEKPWRLHKRLRQVV